MAEPPPPLDDASEDKEASKNASAPPPLLVPPTPTTPGGGKNLPGAAQFASLYVGDLAPEVGEAMLYEAFQTAGTVASCRVCRDSVTRKSLCYGYVNYYSAADAERALSTLNYMPIKGRACRIMWSQRDPSARKNLNSNVFVKNLPLGMDSKGLHDAFRAHGSIVSCKVSTDGQGKSKGYGFVCFETEEGAKAAIEKANGTKIGEHELVVAAFVKREEGDKAADKFTNLYVKHLPLSWGQEKLEAVFGEFGAVTSIWLSATDDGKRFALVNFAEPDSASAAVKALHGKDLVSEQEGQSGEKKEAEEKTSAEPSAEAAPGAEGDAGADDKAAGEKDQENPLKDDIPLHCLYVQRAQTRAERKSLLAKERLDRKGSGKGAQRPGVKLHIGNLSESTTEEQLRKLFEPYGTALHVILRQGEDGKCKGFGFIVLSTMEEAMLATKELQLKEVDGKPLSVSLAENKKKMLRGAPSGEELSAAMARGEPDSAEGGRRGERRRSGTARGSGKGGGKGKVVPPLPYGGAPPPMRPTTYPHAGPFPGGPGFPGAPPYGGPRPGMPYPYPAPLAYGSTGAPYGSPYGTMPYPYGPGAPMMPPMAQAPRPGGPLTRETLAQLPPHMQKQRLGEQLYALIQRHRPAQAGKLTGMMLELDNNEILGLISSDAMLQQKIHQAVSVLGQ